MTLTLPSDLENLFSNAHSRGIFVASSIDIIIIIIIIIIKPNI